MWEVFIKKLKIKIWQVLCFEPSGTFPYILRGESKYIIGGVNVFFRNFHKKVAKMFKKHVQFRQISHQYVLKDSK